MSLQSSKLCKSLRDEKKKYRQKILHKLCCEISYAAKSSKNGKIPYGFVKKMVEETKDEEPWINRNTLNFAYKKFSKHLTTNLERDQATSSTTSITTVTDKAPGGRPKGSTNVMKHHLKEMLLASKNEIASVYLKEKEEYKTKGERLPKFWLKNKIAEVRAKRGIPTNVSISLSTIRSRKGKNVLQSSGPETLMASVEPKLVKLICAMAEIRRCLTASEAIALANSLIEGSETEREIIEWKKARSEINDNSPVLGRKWWQLFKRRWAHRLVTKRGQKFSMDRSNSLTYSNVKKMYDDVYNCMVESGVAIMLDEPSHEFEGDLATKYHLTHPEMCLVVDEVGSNISQRGDGHVTGRKYCCELGAIPQNKSSYNDRHFTCLGFTALTGEPVLCVVIVAGITETFEVEVGIDIEAPMIGDPSDTDFFQNNRGKGKMFPTGPECHFNGKTIPTLVRWSPTGSITSKILVDALSTLDHYQVFNRTIDRKPFLLLDGHGSRFELPFLQYVTDTDHPWMVCQGVPYGTSLWQVADSSEQNGAFKAALSDVKSQIVKKRLDMMMDVPSIIPTDIIPIINYAWERSFARVDSSKKAISDRGWGPLNYNLLTHNQILPTMTKTESIELRSMRKIESSLSTQQSSTTGIIHSTSLSDLTDDIEMNYDPYFLQRIPNSVTVSDKLNFRIGRSAHVARALLHESDILEAREDNQKNANKGKEAREKLEKAKKLTAMLNFKSFGCKIGEDSLQARLKMAAKKSHEAAKIMEKRNNLKLKRKLQYDEFKKKIEDENIPDDKLSALQLKTLLMNKKRDDDKISISKLKRPGLLSLWLEWQSRPDVVIDAELASQNIINGTTEDDPDINDHIGNNMIIDDDDDVSLV